jgi:hypothetical protein
VAVEAQLLPGSFVAWMKQENLASIPASDVDLV